MQYIEGVLHNLIKRKKQAMKVPAAVFLAVIFIAVIVVGSDGLAAYQRALNQKTFGGWFIMENSINGTQSNELHSHPYLTASGKAQNVCSYYTEDDSKSAYQVGYLDYEARSIAKLTMSEGVLPQKQDEIAVEKNTLEKLGYRQELGETITVSYYDNHAVGIIFDKTLSKRTYTLVGIIDNYASYWDSGSDVPTLLVTEEEAQSYGEPDSQTILYALDETIQTTDYKQVYQGMVSASQADTETAYNSRVYDYQGFHLKQICMYASVFAVLAGLLVTISTLIVYHRERKEYYRLFDGIGVAAGQFLTGSAIEGCLLVLPSAAAGMIAGIGVVRLVLWGILRLQKAEAGSIANGSIGELIALTALLCMVLVAAGMALTAVYAKGRQGRKAKNTIRSHKSAWHFMKDNDSAIHYAVRNIQKNGAAGVLRCVFSMSVILVATLCLYGIVHTKAEYDSMDRQPDLVITQKEFTAEGYSGINAIEFNATEDEEQASIYCRYQRGQVQLPDWLPQSLIDKLNSFYGTKSIEESYVENTYFYSIFSDTKGYESYIEEHSVEVLERLPGVKVSLETAYTSGAAENKPRKRYVLPAYEGTRCTQYYVAAQRAVYEELSEYIEEAYLDYEAFARGEQVILLMDKNSMGFYNEEYQVGDTVEYRYDYFYDGNFNTDTNVESSVGALQKEREQFQKQYQLSEAEWEQSLPALKAYRSGNMEEMEQEISTLPEELQEKVRQEIYSEQVYNASVQKNAKVTVVGIVYLDEQTKNALYEKIPLLKEFPTQEIRILSENFVNDRYLTQAEVLCSYLKKEYHPEDYQDLSANVVTVSYGLDSLYQATDNMVQAYLQTEGYSYISHVEENNTYRSRYLNQIFAYIITMLGTVLLYFLVLVIWNYFQMQAEKTWLQLYQELGMETRQIAGGVVLRYLLEIAAGALIGGLGLLCMGAMTDITGYIMTALAFMVIGTAVTAILYGSALRKR